MEIWNDTFFSLDKPCSWVCEGLLGSGREHFGARIFSQRTVEQVCFWEQLHEELQCGRVTWTFGVWAKRKSFPVFRPWRARRRTCLWSFLECFALLCTPDVLTQKWAFLGTTNVTDGVYGFALGWKECVWWCLIPVHVNRQTNQPRVLARRVPYNARLWLFFLPLSLHPRFARWELTL